MNNITKKELFKKVSKSISEQIDLENYKANFTAEDFKNWVDSEWDIETLEMAQGVIQSRLDLLYEIIDVATKKEVKGFR